LFSLAPNGTSEYAGIYFVITLVVAISITSAASIWSIRQGFKHLNYHLVAILVCPSIFIHEMCHFIVLFVLGYKIRGVNLAGIFNPRKPAYVRFSWRTGSIAQRGGLMLGAFAPVWLPSLLIVLWKHYPYVPDSALSVFFSVYFIAVMSSAMALSEEDWDLAATGLIVLTPVIIIVAWFNPFGIFTAPNDAPWASRATYTVGYLALISTAIQIFLGTTYTLIGKIIVPAIGYRYK
jgi:hypothetical protein